MILQQLGHLVGAGLSIFKVKLIDFSFIKGTQVNYRKFEKYRKAKEENKGIHLPPPRDNPYFIFVVYNLIVLFYIAYYWLVYYSNDHGTPAKLCLTFHLTFFLGFYKLSGFDAFY